MARNPGASDRLQKTVQSVLASRRIRFRSLAQSESDSILNQFAELFVTRERQESITLNMRRVRTRRKAVDYHKYFHADCIRDRSAELSSGGSDLVEWLAEGAASESCHLLVSESWVPAFEIELKSLEEHDLFLLSDSYWINLRGQRVVVITRDSDVILCRCAREKRT